MGYFKINLNNNIQFNKAGKFLAKVEFLHQKQINADYQFIVNLENPLYIKIEEFEYIVRKNEVLFIPKAVPFYAYKESTGGCSFLWCHFNAENTCELISDASFESEIDKVTFQNRHNYNFAYIPTHFSPPSVDEIVIIINQILNVNNMPIYTDLYENYLIKILILEITQQAIQLSFPQHHNKRLTGNIIKWLKMNVRNHVTLDDLADYFKYNKHYLGRIFKKETNKTILQYMNYYKMMDAKHLLLNTNMSIKEIAYSLKFEDDKYFLRMFKNKENISPTQFRNTYKNTNYNTTY